VKAKADSLDEFVLIRSALRYAQSVKSYTLALELLDIVKLAKLSQRKFNA